MKEKVLVEGFLNDLDPTFNEESFKDFVNAALDAEYEDFPIFKKVEQAYGTKVAEALVSWIQNEGGDLKLGTKYNNVSTKEVMDLLTVTPSAKILNILEKTLGGGSSGVAVRLKSGLVIKKLFKDFRHQDNADFYSYCLKVKPDVFLPVVKIGKDYIVSQYVEAGSSKCKHYSKEVSKAFSKAKNIDKDFGFVEFIEDEEVKEWAKEVAFHFEKCGGSFSDIKASNLGELNGKVLYIDP